MIKQKSVNIIDKFDFSNEKPFNLIAGPCAMESRDHVMMMAEKIKTMTDRLGINWVFKSSFDKANRTSVHSKRGVGIDAGIKILEEVQKTFDVPTTTDIHEAHMADKVKDVVDIIQIPAFLARQTDLLVAAAKTGKVIDVKKPQFSAPWDMSQVVNKLEESGTEKIMLMERGTTFGYNRLVVDPISFPEMKKFGYPVILDATHCVQLVASQGNITGGMRQYIPNMAMTGLVAGIAGIFMEIHHCPKDAICDATNQFPLDKAEELLKQLKDLDAWVKSQNPIEVEQ